MLPEGEEDEDASTTVVTSKGSRIRKPRRETADFRGVEGGTDPAPFENIVDTDEQATKLDELNNHEDHRLKGGRELNGFS